MSGIFEVKDLKPLLIFAGILGLIGGILLLNGINIFVTPEIRPDPLYTLNPDGTVTGLADVEGFVTTPSQQIDINGAEYREIESINAYYGLSHAGSELSNITLEFSTIISSNGIRLEARASNRLFTIIEMGSGQSRVNYGTYFETKGEINWLVGWEGQNLIVVANGTTVYDGAVQATPDGNFRMVQFRGYGSVSKVNLYNNTAISELI